MYERKSKVFYTSMCNFEFQAHTRQLLFFSSTRVVLIQTLESTGNIISNDIVMSSKFDKKRVNYITVKLSQRITWNKYDGR